MAVMMARMITGEEVLYTAGEQTQDTVEMKKPMLIRIVPQGQESYGLAMVPFSPSLPEATHTLYKRHIVATADVPSNLEKAYIQQTSGIEIVSSM